MDDELDLERDLPIEIEDDRTEQEIKDDIGIVDGEEETNDIPTVDDNDDNVGKEKSGIFKKRPKKPMTKGQIEAMQKRLREARQAENNQKEIERLTQYDNYQKEILNNNYPENTDNNYQDKSYGGINPEQIIDNEQGDYLQHATYTSNDYIPSNPEEGEINVTLNNISSTDVAMDVSNFGTVMPTVLSNGYVSDYESEFVDYGHTENAVRDDSVNPNRDLHGKVSENASESFDNQSVIDKINKDNRIDDFIRQSVYNTAGGTDTPEGTYSGVTIIPSSGDTFNSQDINYHGAYDAQAEYAKNISHQTATEKEISGSGNNVDKIKAGSPFHLSDIDQVSPINSASKRNIDYRDAVITVNSKADADNTSKYVATGKLRNDVEQAISGEAKPDKISSKISGEANGASDTDTKTPDNKSSLSDKNAYDNKSANKTDKELVLAEKQKQEGQIKRKFVNKGDIVSTISDSARRISETAAKGLMQHDETANEESNRAKTKTQDIINDTKAVMGVMGAMASTSSLKGIANKKEMAAIGLKQAIDSNVLTYNDAISSSKKEIKEMLKSYGIKNAGNIAKYKDDTIAAIRARTALNNAGILTDEDKIVVNSSTFFNNAAASHQMQNIYKKYYSKSTDPLVKTMANMDLRNLKRIHKDIIKGKINVNVSDLKVLENHIKTLSANNFQKHSIKNSGHKFGIKKALSFGLNRVMRIESPEAEALGQIYNGAKAAKSIGKLSGHIFVTVNRKLSKIPLTPQWAVKKISKRAMHGIKTAKSAVKSKVASTKTVRRARKTIGKIKDRALQTTAGKGLSAAGKSIGNAQKAYTKQKIKKQAKKNVKKAAVRKITSSAPVRAITAPFRFLGSAFNGLRTIIFKFLKIVGIVIAAIFAFYFLIMLLFTLIDAASTTVINITSTIIVQRKDESMHTLVEDFLEKDAEKYEEAKKIATDPPKHDASHIDAEGYYPDEAYNGEKLYHYGHPQSADDANANMYHNDIEGSETDNGYNIAYLDADGNVVGQDTNNIKDVITLDYMVNDQWFDAIGDKYDESTFLQTQKDCEKWFEILNPEPIYLVSDLYHTGYASDVYEHGDGATYEGKTYYCDDEDWYNRYDEARANGVEFYDTPEPYSEKGCTFDEDKYNEDYQVWTENDDGSNDPPNRDDAKYWYCPGHDALHCSYGFRDVKIYVTVLRKEDVIKAWDNNNILTYKVPTNYDCTEWKDVEIDISSMYTPTIKNQTFLKANGWDDDSSISYVDWINNLYDQDWYDLYGVYVYGNGGLDTSTAPLTQNEVDEFESSWGDVNAGRQDFVEFAMSWEGQIPYGWGAKAGHAGTPKPSKLDCSGFVVWCYWSTFGTKPSDGTANFVPSLGLAKISYKDLQPGDIGMIRAPGASTQGNANHIGIFVGWDRSTGKAIWVHENGGDHNVGINETQCFKVYYRLDK